MPLFRMFFMAMGGQCEIQLDAPAAEIAERAIQLGIDEVARIERKYSRFRPDSFVSEVNAGAGSGEYVRCDSESNALLDYADTLFKTSGGLFDITSGVLRKAWNFRVARLPGDAELAALLPLIAWDRVERKREGIRLPAQGMEIDFGGFGKEYAADRAAAVLHESGIGHAHVNLGGDIRVLGPQADGLPWVVGIRDPRAADRIVASIPLESGGLATSGDYERFFELDGKRYCHILNPRTGRPVSHWRSISVVAPATIAAGSYSTIAMLLEAEARAFLESTGLRYMCIDAAGNCCHS